MLTQPHRDLFPRECYADYYYNVQNGVVDYDEFAKGGDPENTNSGTLTRLNLRVMRRGKVPKVDAFLDTLVGSAIFPAFEQIILPSLGKRCF
jgi:hypothetical protein